MMTATLFIGMPGPMELGIILIIAVLLFGGKLPELAKSLGRSIPSFRFGLAEANKEVKAMEEDLKNAIQETNS